MKQKNKRNKIRNLDIKEFKNLFPKNEWMDFKLADNKGKFSVVVDMLKSETGKDISRGILALLAVGGIIMIAATVPNVFLLFKGLRKNYYKKISREDYKKCVDNLKRHGFVDFEYAENGIVKLIITDKGDVKSKQVQFSNIRIKKLEKWDKKWRIVMFDIPEKHKSAREGLRNKLVDLGFRNIQDSVFLHPYECFKEIDAIVRVYCVDAYVRYFVAEDFYYSGEFKKHFNLV